MQPIFRYIPKPVATPKVTAAQIQATFMEAFAQQQRGNFSQAKNFYDSILRAQPDHFPSMDMLGVLAAQEGNFEEAVAFYDRVLALRPDLAQTHANRGVALLELKQTQAALQSLERAIALKPDYVHAMVNRGVALHALKQLPDAIASYDQALAIHPHYAQAHFNRGAALQAMCQLSDAIASYDRAIALQADYADAHFFKSTVLLLQGDFENGWPLYQWRWKTAESALRERHFQQPLWLGQAPLHGKTILLHSEQGLGDMIQFCRYAQRIVEEGGRVILEMPAPLIGLLRTLEGVAVLVEKGQPLPAFDYHCPLMSLPLAFRTTVNTIPSATAYLRCNGDKLAQWSERLGPQTKPRVGLVWSGNTSHAIDYNRSIPLDTIAPHLSADVEYISLHKEVRPTDQATLDALGGAIRHFGNALQDFEDTAALCTLVDIVVSVDTSVAHLSGALGRPTWILLPYVPDWRWMLERKNSPWYPSVTLYRQATDGDWEQVLTAVQTDLQEKFAPNQQLA
jgi:tetratricopeptide (TPR) repeat protein